MMAPGLEESHVDQVLFRQSPLLIAPRFKALPELEIDSWRFVATDQGIWIQGRSAALEASVPFQRFSGMPYGRVDTYTKLSAGPVPRTLIQRVIALAVDACPREWAGALCLDPKTGEYALYEPRVISASAAHIRFDEASYPAEQLVVDVHTHGDGAAYFSQTDDLSDRQGIHLSVVLGQCRSRETIYARERVCIHGRFIEPDGEWECNMAH